MKTIVVKKENNNRETWKVPKCENSFKREKQLARTWKPENSWREHENPSFTVIGQAPVHGDPSNPSLWLQLTKWAIHCLLRDMEFRRHASATQRSHSEHLGVHWIDNMD